MATELVSNLRIWKEVIKLMQGCQSIWKYNSYLIIFLVFPDYGDNTELFQLNATLFTSSFTVSMDSYVEFDPGASGHFYYCVRKGRDYILFQNDLRFEILGRSVV
jgi:hypothetical protein